VKIEKRGNVSLRASARGREAAKQSNSMLICAIVRIPGASRRGNSPWMCQAFVNRSLRRRWYLAVRSGTYLGFLVPGVVMTPVGAHYGPASMAACIRAQNAASMSR
jgi:hypothetical protein